MKPRRDNGGMTLDSPMMSDGSFCMFIGGSSRFCWNGCYACKNSMTAARRIGGAAPRVSTPRTAFAFRAPSVYLKFKREFEKGRNHDAAVRHHPRADSEGRRTAVRRARLRCHLDPRHRRQGA